MKKIYLAALAIFTMVSCTQNDLVEDNAQNILYASMQPNSRLAVNGYEVKWAKGDAFLAITNDLGTPQNAKYTLMGEESTKVGKFASEKNVNGLKYAMYPADSYHNTRLDGADHAYIVSILKKEYASGKESLNLLPLYGKIEGSKVSFNHTVAVLKITITGLDVTKYTKVKVSANRGIAGYFKVDTKGKDQTGSIDGGQTDSKDFNEKDVFFNFDGTSNEFYLPIPMASASKGYQYIRFFGVKKDGKADKFHELKWEKPGRTFEAGKIYSVTFDASKIA